MLQSCHPVVLMQLLVDVGTTLAFRGHCTEKQGPVTKSKLEDQSN